MAPAQRSCWEGTREGPRVTSLDLCPPVPTSKPVLCAKDRRFKQPLNAFPRFGRGSRTIPTCPIGEPSCPAGPYKGIIHREKGVKEMDWRLNKHRPAPAFASSLRLSKGEGRAQESSRQHFASWPQGKGVFKSILYPHNFPENYGPTTPGCWRGSGWLQTSGEDGMEVTPAGKRQWNPQIQCWDWNPRPAEHWDIPAGSTGGTAGTDLAFIIFVVPIGWQTCQKNKRNYKAAQPVWTLTCPK